MTGSNSKNLFKLKALIMGPLRAFAAIQMKVARATRLNYTANRILECEYRIGSSTESLEKTQSIQITEL